MGPIGQSTDGLGGASFKLFVDDAPLTNGLKRAERQAKETSRVIGDEIHKGSTRGAMGLLALSQAVDDAQYGFRAIVNNIPQVAMMFGAAGLAGGIGIAAVAVNQLLQHWDDIANVFRTDFMKRQAEATAELAEQTKAAADEAERLLKAQMPSHEAGKAGIEKGIKEAGAPGVAEAVAAALGREMKQIEDKLAAKGLQLMENGRVLTPQEKADRLKERARQLLGSAGTNEGSRIVLENMINQNPDLFAGVPKFARALKGAAPGRMAETEMLNKQGEQNEAIDKDIEATRKLTEAKVDAQIKIDEENILRDLDIQNRRKRQQLEGQIDILEGHRKHLMDAAHNTNPSQVFQGGRAFSTAMLTGGLDQIAKAQLKEAEKLNLKIDALRNELRGVGRPILRN